MSKRLPTDGGESFQNNPFGGLESKGLPKGLAVQKQAKAPENKKRSRGRIDVRREKAGRGGKTVTTLSGFLNGESERELDAMAFDLKKVCACGGTRRARVIELQGDVRDKAIPELQKRGYQAVRAGG